MGISRVRRSLAVTSKSRKLKERVKATTGRRGRTCLQRSEESISDQQLIQRTQTGLLFTAACLDITQNKSPLFGSLSKFHQERFVNMNNFIPSFLR